MMGAGEQGSPTARFTISRRLTGVVRPEIYIGSESN